MFLEFLLSLALHFHSPSDSSKTGDYLRDAINRGTAIIRGNTVQNLVIFVGVTITRSSVGGVGGGEGKNYFR